MDIVLDLWAHAIYNDEQVQGSELGPVVYFRNCTGSPLTNYSDLALRWGIRHAPITGWSMTPYRTGCRYSLPLTLICCGYPDSALPCPSMGLWET